MIDIGIYYLTISAAMMAGIFAVTIPAMLIIKRITKED